MDEFGNKHLYNNLTVKVRTKKIIPIRQIIIKKNGTNVKSIIPKPKYNNITYNTEESDILHRSAFLNTINPDEIQINKNNSKISDLMNKTIGWQFTETGVAGSGINIKVDVNIIKNEFFSRFINKK